MTARNTTPLTPERLRELLRYDPETGLFTRLTRTHYRWRAGTTAGWTNGVGYVMLWVDGLSYLAHRLAFLYMTGEWPKFQVDHRDCVRTNNRWDNLRDLPSAINNQNQRRPNCKNKLGAQGVVLQRHCKRYRATLTTNKQTRHLGYFDTAEEAHAAYVAAKRLYHTGNTL